MIQCDKFVVICVYVLVLLDPNRIKAVEYKDSVPSPGFYAAISKPNYVAATVATAPHDKVVVYGQPRVTSGHPNTIWDSEDINRYKEMLKSNQDLQFLFTQMKERLGKQMLEPVNTPQPQRDAVAAVALRPLGRTGGLRRRAEGDVRAPGGVPETSAT